MNVQTEIENAIIAAVEAMANAAPFTNIPFEYPNRKLDPTPENYVQVVQLRNNQRNYAWGEGTVYPGILQLNVVGAVDQGTGPLLDLCDAIVATFPKGRDMRSGGLVVKIEVEPEVLSTLQDGHKATVPVSIRYRCFV